MLSILYYTVYTFAHIIVCRNIKEKLAFIRPPKKENTHTCAHKPVGYMLIWARFPIEKENQHYPNHGKFMNKGEFMSLHCEKRRKFE